MIDSRYIFHFFGMHLRPRPPCMLFPPERAEIEEEKASVTSSSSSSSSILQAKACRHRFKCDLEVIPCPGAGLEIPTSLYTPRLAMAPTVVAVFVASGPSMSPWKCGLGLPRSSPSSSLSCFYRICFTLEETQALAPRLLAVVRRLPLLRPSQRDISIGHAPELVANSFLEVV